LAKEISAKRNVDSIVALVQTALRTTATTDEPPDAAIAYLTSPSLQRNSLIDVRVTLPLEQFLDGVGKQQELRAAIQELLQKAPLPDDPSALPLDALVTRLVLSQTIGEQEQAAQATVAIV